MNRISSHFNPRGNFPYLHSSRLYTSSSARSSLPVPSHTATMTQESSRNSPITKVEDRLYLGDSISSRRKAILQEHHISAVASLSDGRWVHWSQPWYKEMVCEGRHLFVPCNDSTTQDLLPELARICDFIQTCQHSGSSDHSNALVHCDRGISRSATAVTAYLMRAHRWSFDTALAFVQAKRRVKPNENFKEQLRVWETVGYEIWEDGPGKIPKPAYAAYLAQRAERLQELGLTGNEPVGIQSL